MVAEVIGVLCVLMRGSLSAAVAVTALAVAPVASAANGLEPGVHIDPGSPAGKQYQIPVAAARGEGSGGSGGLGSSSGTSAPAFGVGVKPTISSSRTTGTSGASDGKRATVLRRHHAQPGGRGAGGRAGGAGSSARQPVSEPTASRGLASPSAASSPGGDNSWLALAGGGALVLLVGGGSGFVLRRRLTPR